MPHESSGGDDFEHDVPAGVRTHLEDRTYIARTAIGDAIAGSVTGCCGRPSTRPHGDMKCHFPVKIIEREFTPNPASGF